MTEKENNIPDSVSTQNEIRPYQLEELEKNRTIVQIQRQVLHEGPHSHAVHPIAERLLFAGFLDVRDFLVSCLQRGIVVEEIAYEGQVKLSVTFDNILDAHKLAAVHLLGVF